MVAHNPTCGNSALAPPRNKTHLPSMWLLKIFSAAVSGSSAPELRLGERAKIYSPRIIHKQYILYIICIYICIYILHTIYLHYIPNNTPYIYILYYLLTLHTLYIYTENINANTIYINYQYIPYIYSL